MQEKITAASSLTPEEEESLELALQGGLKGRLTREFCIVQATLDALQRKMETELPPALYAGFCLPLQQMADRLQSLERMAEHTADLARTNTLCVPRDAIPMELSAYLRELCANTNQELAHMGSPARVRLEAGEQDPPFPLQSSPETLDRLFSNLFSNSLRARPDTTITIRCTPDRRLLYRDSGPGLPPELAELWGNWADAAAPLHRGRLGLYMTMLYSRDLDWQILPPPVVGEGEKGFAIGFQLPPAPPALPKPPALYSEAAWQAERRSSQLHCLHREFAALRSGG